jgi:DNA-binding NtrC family response regulator
VKRTILVVSPFREDQACLSAVVERSGFEVRAAHTCREALALLDEEVFLVISERVLPDGGWTDLLERTAEVPHGPCLIVTASTADDRLWAEVLNSGGYDVLARPFSAEEVRRVVELAHLHWSGDRAGRCAAAAGGA